MTKVFGLDFETYRAQSIKALDTAAEAFRDQFITPGSGMAMTYLTKLREAEAFLADAAISSFETPHLTAEAEIDGMTRMEKATQIVVTAYEWTNLSAKIDALRIIKKKEIEAAYTPSEIRAILQFQWESTLV